MLIAVPHNAFGAGLNVTLPVVAKCGPQIKGSHGHFTGAYRLYFEIFAYDDYQK